VEEGKGEDVTVGVRLGVLETDGVRVCVGVDVAVGLRLRDIERERDGDMLLDAEIANL
jgi:hypothetical protein